jgi:hypothetical protein
MAVGPSGLKIESGPPEMEPQDERLDRSGAWGVVRFLDLAMGTNVPQG